MSLYEIKISFSKLILKFQNFLFNFPQSLFFLMKKAKLIKLVIIRKKIIISDTFGLRIIKKIVMLAKTSVSKINSIRLYKDCLNTSKALCTDI